MPQQKRNDMPCIVEIQKITTESHDVKTYFFYYPYNTMPGQFLMVWVPGVDEIPLSVSYTGTVKGITVKFVGEATGAMEKLIVGDRLGIRGPYGTHFERKDMDRILVVAGGIGIAPLAPAIESFVGQGTEITLTLGAVTSSELLFVKRLEDVCELHIATDDGSSGYHGYVSNLADDIMKTGNFDGIFTCGPEIMMKKVVDSAMEKGIPFWVCIERYMKCGVGICDSCAMNGVLVCRDGPVFSGDTLRGLDTFGKFRRNASGNRVQL